jgi:hypothetical protein
MVSIPFSILQEITSSSPLSLDLVLVTRLSSPVFLGVPRVSYALPVITLLVPYFQFSILTPDRRRVVPKVPSTSEFTGD